MTEDQDEISLERPALMTIRKAVETDIPQLLDMIGLLAAFHGDAVEANAEGLKRDLFGPAPWVTALVADGGSQLLGYALLTPLYRAQQGLRGMDLHHLFVRDGHRSHGVGQHLIARARDFAKAAGCAYLSVSAATGNTKAHQFYQQMEFVARPVTGMRYLQSLA
ncbi:GNAT family N-acetyltransferase [Martelella sp. AD-3]|uniref:GNAT family N-acetyltransferase n=1 Tax=Martelella sp. AD-3 TaxID=686597 RepID=UPI00046769FC|nr:GNAT family N-acetyltransferase [Martelella sp. AD-3]AMM85241.1 acetyltransferase [Martelella sp. AD-3]